MSYITDQDLARINEINGTLADRYEYFAKLAEILGADYARVRWNKNRMQAIALDDTTILDIQCKTIKGRMMIKMIYIENYAKTEAHPYGHTDLYELKKGKLTEWVPR